MSQRALKKFTPDDEERPPLARYIPSWEGYNSELAKKYPFQLISPHPRMTFHTHHDTHSPWLAETPANRIFKDGYPWHVVRIHPIDADSRNIKDRDIVKLYNDRASVLGIAQVTERIRPGLFILMKDQQNTIQLNREIQTALIEAGVLIC